MNAKWKDILVRAAKTFAQAFMGAISIDVLFATADRSVWRSMLLGGIAAGFSALWNYMLHELNDAKGEENNGQG